MFRMLPSGMCLAALIVVVLTAIWSYIKSRRESKQCTICGGLGFLNNRFDSYKGHPCHSCQGSGHVSR